MSKKRNRKGLTMPAEKQAQHQKLQLQSASNKAQKVGIADLKPALSASGKVTKRTRKVLSCAARLKQGNHHDKDSPSIKEQKRYAAREDRLLRDKAYLQGLGILLKTA